MKKRVLSLLLCIMLVVGMVPTTAFAAAGTWEVNLNVSESSEYKYNGQNTLALGFGVQSDDLKLKTAQSIVLAIDLNVLDFLQMPDSDVEVYNTSDTKLGENENALATTAQNWNVNVYCCKSSDGKTGYMQILASTTKNQSVTTLTNIATVYLGFKSGKSISNLTSTSIRLINKAEAVALEQSSAVMISDGNTNEQYAILADGSTDTLTGGVQVSWVGITPTEPPKPALTGSVSITGTPKFGETLTADTTALNYNGEAAGTLTYQWYRGDTAIPSATGSSYTTAAADVGKTIKVEVKNSNNSSSVFSAPTADVAKGNGPTAPTGLAVVSVTDTTITVTPNADWEYSKDNGSTWQNSNVFTGLTANTTYNQIVARVKATATHEAGTACAAITATTASSSADATIIAQLKATHTPYTGTYDGNSHNAFTVTAPSGGWSGWSVMYKGHDASASYSSTMPQVKDVADGGKIYVKFSHTSYADVIAEYDVKVSKKSLTVTANDHTITYGDAPANSGVAITGFVTGETASNLAGTLSYDYNYTQYGNVGDYSITPKGYTSANYDITYKPGKLTVGQKVVGLTWAGDTGRVWGDGNTVTATATGMVNSDVINVTVTGGNETAVGSHTATATGLTGEKAGNYKLPAAYTQTYNIGKADLTPAPADKEVKHIHTASGEMTVSLAEIVPGATNYTLGTPTGATAILSTYSVDTTSGKVKYNLKGTGASGNTATLPVTITSTNYNDVTVNVKITLTDKMDQAALTLTGGETVVYGQTLKLGTSGGSGDGAVTYAVTNGTGKATINATTGELTPVKVGTITVTATKEGGTDYNSTTSNPVTITITQAKPTGTPTFTKITEKGKTLNDAALTVGTLNPTGGTIEWVDDTGTALLGNTKVEANKEYKWRYTPASADAVNYAPVYGTIVVYPVSTGIVIYSPCYTIKASAGANGSISPAGWCSVVENGSQTFTFTPDKGYTVAKVLVDGKSVGAVKSYTFKNVTKDHTIEVIFMKSNGNPATGVFVMP